MIYNKLQIKYISLCNLYLYILSMSKIDFSKMNVKNIESYLKQINEKSKDLSNIDFKYFTEQKNKLEEKIFEQNPNTYDDILYPNINDPNFNKKIFQKKEFNDLEVTKYTGTVEENINKICEADFELAPHQIFIRNFLSFLTPYNSLMLYHGLGTGKTCSAITVCEEMRQYMKQVGIHKKIIIVASPNVQQNFRTQLFDERKLKEVDGLWNLRGCTGSTFIKEVNPMSMKGLKKENLIKQINKIINQYYVFMGYTEFSNYITNIKNKYLDETQQHTESGRKLAIQSIKKEFSNRLIVIDEVHNIRISSDNPKKTTAENLLQLVKYSSTLKLLLLSATPMFNNAREIVWLTNLMNINDNRPPIEVKDVFDKNGALKIVKGKEVGKELLLRKLRGYVSFLRGENPFSFPYRIYPNDFSPSNSIKYKDFTYPRYQINKNVILEGLNHLDLYMTNMGSTQKLAYQMAIKDIQETLPDTDAISKDGSRGMGWKQIGPPLQTLNIVYPSPALDKYDELSIQEKKDSKLSASNFIGNDGLYSVMDSNRNTKHDFSYKSETLDKYGRIFSSENLIKYSGKIHSIVENIKKSKGIVLIYSQYIDSGCIPLALALEEAGLARYSGPGSSAKSLFSESALGDVEPVDSLTMMTKRELEEAHSTDSKKPVFNQAKYILITGDKKISPNNKKEVKAATNDTNINGKDVKVVIISEAGSEGIDFNNIRQVHILEPWYNMSRIEQIIGRAVRFKSHCKQPIEERNVEIYLYGSNPVELLVDEKEDASNIVEPLDLYIYRLAEQKALQIGIVSRILKENSVDCLLNSNVNSLTTEELNTTFKMRLSSGKTIDYRVGDKAFTQICDYMEKCDYKCLPDVDKEKIDINIDTYNKEFILLNTEKIILRIKELYKEKFVYSKEDLIKHITYAKNYPLIQIDSALQFLIEEQSEYLTDMFGRLGKLVNIDNYYMFQPVELTDEKITMYRRKKPVEYKHDVLNVKLDKELKTYLLKGVKKDISKKETDLKQQDIGESLNKNYKIVMEQLTNTYNSRIEKTSVKRGVKDENAFFMPAVNYLAAIMSIDDELETIHKLILHMLFDRLTFTDKKTIIEYLNIHGASKEIEKTIITYIDDSLKLPTTRKNVYLLSDDSKKVNMWIFNTDKQILEKAQPTDFVEYKDELLELRYDESDYFTITGFISFISKTKELVFKVKNNTLKRHLGARCDQAGKKNIIKIINMLPGGELFTIDNTKGVKTEILCILQELMLRYYDAINKDNKKWFLNLELALWNELETIKK
jgi:hypothetical protein